MQEKATNDLQFKQCHAADENGMVCFCYRKTVGELKALRAEHGSLKRVQELTNVGNGCGGCRIILHSLFEEELTDINEIERAPAHGTSCVKPGQRLMTAFIVANDLLESRVVSSNGVAPQLGACDSTTPLEYLVLSQNGEILLKRSLVLNTNETFCFDTRREDLPRPFTGMFVLGRGRSNFGAGRFNVQWMGNGSVTSTHENFETGRPRIYLPFFFSREFLDSSNEFYIALSNPHSHPLGLNISMFEKDAPPKLTARAEFGPYCSQWINGREALLAPIFSAFPDGQFATKFEADGIGEQGSIVVNLFFFNRETGHWSCQHL